MKPDSNNEIFLSKETIKRIKDTSRRYNISPDKLMSIALDLHEIDKNRSRTNQRKKNDSPGFSNLGGSTNNAIDFSNLLQFANNELIEHIRRITNSIEKIESTHEEGWKNLESGELIRLLERITNGVEKIEREQNQGWTENKVDQLVKFLGLITVSVEDMKKDHARGWADQRRDLGAIVKRLDKLM